MTSRLTELRAEVIRRRRQRDRDRLPAVIALDCMGTDHGPDELLRGAHWAVHQYPLLTVIATGPADRLNWILRHEHLTHRRLLVEDAPEVVLMDEAPRDSLKKEKSSISVAARLVREGKAQAVVSAGNTGATMAHVLMQWRRLPNISRPAVSAFIPHPRHPCIFLDVGANVDCRPRHLLDFAVMGSEYARTMFHLRRPRVGLLSNGEEDSKGDELTIETRKLLKQAPLNFVGNAEGRDLFKGDYDVVVCDGFVGNALLKFGEGLVEFIFENLKVEVRKNVMAQLGALTMMPVFKTFRKNLDANEHGGAPLLGLNGNCIICHGSSKAKAIGNAIRTAGDLVGAKLNERIVESAKAVHDALNQTDGDAEESTATVRPAASQ